MNVIIAAEVYAEINRSDYRGNSVFIRLLDWLIVVGSLIGLALVGWWAVYSSSHSAERLQSELQSTVEAELINSGHSWASVEMFGQRAVIGGEAPADDAFEAAREVALTADGYGGLLFGGVTIVQDASEAAEPITPYKWRAVKTADQRIILTGHVPSEAIRQAILSDAEAIAPGRVDDRTSLGVGAPNGNWQGIARMGLKQLGSLNSGYASLNQTKLTVSGVAMSDAAKATVIADVANIAAPYSSRADIAGRSLWSARHDKSQLILSGQVATEADKSEITSIATRHFSGDVIDQMSVKESDQRDWVDGVRLGLPHFAKFKSGEMAFEPDGDGFTFNGEASGSTLSYLAEDMKKFEGPYEVSIAAETVQVEVAEIQDIDFNANAVEACQAAFDAVLATNKVYFASGKDIITRQSGETLDKIMAVSGKCQSDLIFELGGHTDSVGSRASNLELSQDRAKAVVAYMVAAGMMTERMKAVGYGPDQPAASNETPAGRAQNRRIEFTVKERSE